MWPEEGGGFGGLFGRQQQIWDGISALEPEGLLRHKARMAEVEQRAIAAHPSPKERRATVRQMRAQLPAPVGSALTSVDRLARVQSGHPPPSFAPPVARTQLKQHELPPRMISLEARRDMVMAKLSRLAERA